MKKYFIAISVLSLSFTFCFAQSGYDIDKFVYISPVPGSGMIRPETNIIIRYSEAFQNISIPDPNLIIVKGAISGIHNGTLFLTEDSKSLVFQPDVPFDAGELVSVSLRSGLKSVSGKSIDSLGFEFTITNGCPILNDTPTTNFSNRENKVLNAFSNNLSGDSSLIYPSYYPKISFSNKNNLGEGDYFLAVSQDVSYLTIINNNGVPIFYKKELSPIYDFKVQPSGLLTYYLKTNGKFYGLDSLYSVVDSFYTGNGLTTDFHDLQVLPDGNAFLIAYDREPVQMDTVNNWDTTACVEGCIIQEINKQKNVIWQWRSWDHYKITDSDSTLVDLHQATIYYCHVNSIDIVDDSTMVISTRLFNEVTAINRITGKIIWRFGGKKNQFSIDGSSPDFILQHDARLLKNNTLSLFDNGSPYTRPVSRGLIYRIDTRNKTGKLLKNLVHSPTYFAYNLGNLQITQEGNIIIGWGNEGGSQFNFTEYDSSGTVLNDARLANNSIFWPYRAFKFPWNTRLITTDQDSIIFDNVQPNNSSQKSLKVYNNSNRAINISGVFNSDTLFNVLQNFPIEVSSKGEISLNVEYNPIDFNGSIDTIYIVSKDSVQMVAKQVVLIGNPKTTAVENDNSKKIVAYKLLQNYPNPFNPATTISYEIPKTSFITLKVYDILGRQVKTLVNKEMNSGSYETKFDASSLTSGIYFYSLQAGSFSQSKKMILLK